MRPASPAFGPPNRRPGLDAVTERTVTGRGGVPRLPLQQPRRGSIGMSARRRALVILGSLMAAIVSVALLLIAGTGTVDSQTAPRGIRVAGTTATNLDLFRGEVLVWTGTRLSTTEVARVRDSSKVAAISAVRTGLLPVTSGRIDYPVIPVEAMSVDPDAYAAAVGPAGTQLAGMLGRGVVLSRTGAGLRKLKKRGDGRLAGGRAWAVGGVVAGEPHGGFEAARDPAQGRKVGFRHP